MEEQDIGEQYIQRNDRRDPRESLNQNLQPDIQKLDSIIRKITEKRAPLSELYRLESALGRLQATLKTQIEIGITKEGD